MSTDLTTTNDLPAVDLVDTGLTSVQRADEIRQIMATDRARYFRDGLDQELAEIEANRTGAFDNAVVPLPPARSMALMRRTADGNELVAAWQTSMGGFDRQLETVQRNVMRIMGHMGEVREQKAFMARFDRDLSERTRYHIYNELRNGTPAHTPPVSHRDLELFGSNQPGADMLKEWGAMAPYRVARIWARVARFRDALDDEDEFDAFRDWYDGQRPSVIKSILRFLSE